MWTNVISIVLASVSILWYVDLSDLPVTQREFVMLLRMRSGRE